MEPCFDKEKITLYNCRCEEVIDDMPDDVVCLTDPPFGGNYEKRRNSSRGRGNIGKGNDFALMVGDNVPFNPLPLLRFNMVALFGANHFADKLPPSSSWIVWDKLAGLASDRDVGFCDSSDCELIWTSHKGPARILRHRWMGLMKGSEHGENRVHPTQKPIKLMEQLVRYLSKQGDTIFDPYAGSGTTAIACYRQNRRFIGCECVEEYAEVAVKRIEDEMGGSFIRKFNTFAKRKRRRKDA